MSVTLPGIADAGLAAGGVASRLRGGPGFGPRRWRSGTRTPLWWAALPVALIVEVAALVRRAQPASPGRRGTDVLTFGDLRAAVTETLKRASVPRGASPGRVCAALRGAA